MVIKRKTTDRYGRIVAEFEIDGVNVNQLMAHEGYANVDERYVDHCEWSAELMQD